MRRRDFMTILVGAAAYPLLAGAQQKAMPVIGYLGSASPGSSAPFLAAFHQGLSEDGYVEGDAFTRSIAFEAAADQHEKRYDCY